MCRPLFMGSQNMFDLPTVLIKCVINIKDCSAGVTEYGIYPLLLQTFYQNFRSR